MCFNGPASDYTERIWILVNLKQAFLLTAGGEKVNLFLAKSLYLPLPDFIY